MKLLIMSDSHRNIDYMLLAVEQTNPNAIMHLGDHTSDAVNLQRRFPDTTVYIIRGNCDPNFSGEAALLLPVEGVKILLTHGHIFDVKTGLESLVEHAIQQEADLVLFGHTHKALIEQKNGLTLMNPGQMRQHDSFFTASYGVVTLSDGKFDCEIVYFP